MSSVPEVALAMSRVLIDVAQQVENERLPCDCGTGRS